MSFPPAVTDAVIVGAGPAGTATAIALRRLGVEVTLLDRAVFPRDKVCGDVLLPDAQQTLAKLGLDSAALQAGSYACTGVSYVPSNGATLAGVFADAGGERRPWWMVRRRELDAWLLREAEQAGTAIMVGISAETLLRTPTGAVEGVACRAADGRTFGIRAKVVVGADGASSTVAREVGAFSRLPAHTCIAARAYVEGLSLPDPYLEVYTTRSTLPGCAWIAPVGPTSANVGIGIVLSTANRSGVTPQALFQKVRRDSPLLADRLKNAGELRLRGWTLPAATEGRAMAGPGWLLVGDAAALVDPFTGHGIQNALMSGVMAGEAISTYLADHSCNAAHLVAYEQRCRTALADEIRTGSFLQRLHSNSALMRVVTCSCAGHRGLRDTFIALVGHAAPRRSLLSVRALIAASFGRRGRVAA